VESHHDLIFLFEHDLFGKPVSTFPDHALMTSPAALSPESRAPCAVVKKLSEVASPAKNNLPSTGAASTARAGAWSGSACE
jgi:hypothetical protein